MSQPNTDAGRAVTQPEGGRVCFKCSAPLGAGDKRCPFCGSEQPAPSPMSVNPPPFEAAQVGLTDSNKARIEKGSRPVVLPPRKEPISAMTILGGFVLVAGVGAGVWQYIESNRVVKPPPPPMRLAPIPAVISSVSGLAVPDADRADPTGMLPLMRRTVVPENPEAQLIGIYVTRSRKGYVDLRDPESSISYAYVVPTDKAPVKPKGPNVGKGYELKLNAGGPTTPPLKKDDWPVLEPNCVWSAAWRSAVRGGIPEDAAVDGVYEKINGEPRWRITVPGKPELTREVDGMSCVLKPH